VPGFCKAATREAIAGHGYMPTPGRYVGAAAVAEDETPFAERFAALRERLEGQFEEGERLTGVIRESLSRLLPPTDRDSPPSDIERSAIIGS